MWNGQTHIIANYISKGDQEWISHPYKICPSKKMSFYSDMVIHTFIWTDDLESRSRQRSMISRKGHSQHSRKLRMEQGPQNTTIPWLSHIFYPGRKFFLTTSLLLWSVIFLIFSRRCVSVQILSKVEEIHLNPSPNSQSAPYLICVMVKECCSFPAKIFFLNDQLTLLLLGCRFSSFSAASVY